MKLKFKYTERYVITFLLVACIILATTVGLVVMNKKYFETKLHYKAKLADANGLSVSTPIYFKGFKIGEITEFRLTPDNYIEADLVIYREYKDKVVYNSALWKGLNPVTNTGTIEFLQGQGSNSILPENSTLPAVDVPEGRSLLLENKVKKSGDPLSVLMENMESFTENLTADTIQSKSAIFRMINNFASASEDLKQVSQKVNALTTALLKDKNPQDGALFRLINNGADLTEEFKTTNQMLKKTLAQADSMLAVYKKPDGLALRMIDPKGDLFVNPLRQTISGFNAMIPRLDSLTTYMNSKSTDMTTILDDMKITLKQAQATFDALNRFLRIEDGQLKNLKPTPSTDSAK
jgi:ABC-type transporter Mla subunit MlaD